ncbi:LysR family substrate-binding domain-containing protein [Catenulispora subtropica]|uniref:LysR substrate-binding domain-containing protein n=1 Tax=Catenulispora subtropica TaxID=450798 RepID=A0ABN2SA05_9ACTN
MTGTQASATFRLAYVPGVTPAKWVRTWTERLPEVPLELVAVEAADAERALKDGEADAALLRLPVDRTTLSAIPLYTETTVAVIPKDHDVTAVEEAAQADLGDYVVLHPLDDTLPWDTAPPGRPAIERPATTADAIELVAAGIGVLLTPQSLARLHHRKDLTYRPLTDGPQSSVALAWLEDRTTDLVEEFIGIVRGRTVNSSRGRAPTPPAAQQKQKRAETGGARSKPASSRTGAGTSRRQGSKPAKPRRRK